MPDPPARVELAQQAAEPPTSPVLEDRALALLARSVEADLS